MPTLDSSIERILEPVVASVAGMPGVVAVSLGGSFAAGLADEASDLDLHVYWRAPLAGAALRTERLAAVADPGSVKAEILTWGLEDHFALRGRHAELIYVSLDDLLIEVDQAYGDGLTGEGFTTASLYYVANGRPLHDPTGELAALRARLLAAYPEATRRRLLASHPELLRVYLAQLRRAQARVDLLYVQHRRYTVQMVFFNALFALNRRYHPGEKRLLVHAERCALRPADCVARWTHVAWLAADDPALAEALGGLVDDLCELIEEAQ
jgi:hypothetical protein